MAAVYEPIPFNPLRVVSPATLRRLSSSNVMRRLTKEVEVDYMDLEQ